MAKQRYTDDETGINITPMLDVVFVMLILFIVAISFIDEEGLEIPFVSGASSGPVPKQDAPIEVMIDAWGQISLQGSPLGPDAVYASLERYKTEMPNSSLIITTHPDTDSQTLAAVLDAARAVGFDSLSVSTKADQ